MQTPGDNKLTIKSERAYMLEVLNWVLIYKSSPQINDRQFSFLLMYGISILGFITI